jgi:bifunctional non-homologous end joining protein LigD
MTSGPTRTVRIGGRDVQLSNPDKVLFPHDGITKAELVEYYRRIARRMVPHLRDRPLTMERFPNGVDGERVFQKGIPKYFPEWIDRVEVPKEGGTVVHPLCQDAATLVYVANQACITPHVWLSRRDRFGLDHPDQLIVDLDPDPAHGFEQARLAAISVKGLLDEVGLASFVKTTGSKGLHVTVPLDRRSDADAVRAFALELGEVLVAREPELLTLEFRKDKRGGRLLVDLKRNGYAQTAVPPYSVRARPGATVATPIDWSEIESPGLRPYDFTIRTIFGRLERIEDPWSGMARRARSLRTAGRKLRDLRQR